MTTAAATTPDALMVDTRWVAGLLGISERHVDRLAADGLMPPPVRLGRLVRWDRRVVETWVADGCPSTKPGAGT